VTRATTRVPEPAHRSTARPVSHAHDPSEREADRAAEVVARGGSVAGWSFSAVPVSDPLPVQRQEGGAPKSDEDEKKEAVTKAGEAFLETKAGKALTEAILADPVVSAVVDAATSPAGLAVAAGGVAVLGATGQPLPFQPPAISLDRITPGLSAQVTYTGPVNAPTFVGLSLTYKEQAPPAKGPRKTASELRREETARLAAEHAAFRRTLRLAPGSKEAEEERLTQEAIAQVVARQSSLPLFVPLAPAPEKKEEERAPVQRKAASKSDTPPSFAGVDAALSTPGRPLDPATRRSMEARFGHDFSRVRLHDDAVAAAASKSVDAAAFTIGDDVVFGAGRYDPSSPAGRHLLAHELAHVVQQSAPRRSSASGPLLQRRGPFESLGILLGLVEGHWEDRELQAYVTAITRSGQIEGDYDSDNKARAVVRRWKESAPGFELVAGQKVLLIREMLDGPTLGEDEVAILDVLELSNASDLRLIFAANGISLAALERDIAGDNRTRLDTFVANRFRGGRDALMAGTVDVMDGAVPAGAPRFGFDPATLDARFDSELAAEDLIAIVAGFSASDRTRALHYLVTVRRPRQLAVLERLDEMYEQATDDARREEIARLDARAREEMLKTERVLLHFFREAVPATAAELRAGTAPTDPARAAELREAMRPPVRKAPSGAVVPFRATLPGETQSYEDKLRARLPSLVDEYYTGLVEGRGRAEHDDPNRVHTLTEFEAIGNVAKDETDKVFGGFYDRKAHPALRADRPKRRGNIHDQFEEAEQELRRAGKSGRRDMAKWLLFYFFQSDTWVRRLNRDHDASPSFDDKRRPQNDEARSLDKLATEFVATPANVTRLNEIYRNWAGVQSEGEIFVQLFRAPTPEKDRLLLWEMFQTLIHEYLHTLVHRKYQKAAAEFGTNSNEWNTLMEGVDSLLTEIVWVAVEPHVKDKDLRKQIEGKEIAELPPIEVPHVSALSGRYASYTEALRLVDLVGVTNLYAAYFLGLVDRIGLSKPKKKGA